MLDVQGRVLHAARGDEIDELFERASLADGVVPPDGQVPPVAALLQHKPEEEPQLIAATTAAASASGRPKMNSCKGRRPAAVGQSRHRRLRAGLPVSAVSIEGSDGPRRPCRCATSVQLGPGKRGTMGEERGAETSCSSCFHSRSVPSGSLPKLEVAGSSPVVGCIREPGAAFACQLIASSEARRCRRAPPRLRRRCGRWTSSRRPGRRSAAEVVAGVRPWALPTCPRAARGRGAVRSHRAAAREN